MNFLLHRHFALQETGSEAIGFGAMLPDLVRLVDRRWRPRASRAEPAVERTPIARELRLGIAHHLEADLWFHRTDVFREGEKRTAAALRSVGDAAPRLALFGHVTWEMCLDGAWLRRTGDVGAALTVLRDDVERLAVESDAALREASGEAASGADASEVVDERLALLWKRLPDLAAGYADGGGVARRLDGIRRALGLPAASEDTRLTWSRALDACLRDAEAAIPALEAERDRALSPGAATTA